MTIGRLNNEKQSVLAPKRRLQKIGLQKMRRGSIYKENNILPGLSGALERGHACARSH